MSLTPKGEPSTDKKSLAGLVTAQDSALAQLLLDYSEANSAMSTVKKSFEKAIAYYGTEGRSTVPIKTNVNQVGTESGRSSSNSPNLQNISNSTYHFVDGSSMKIRDLFRAPDGYWLLSVDYSQLELRLLAHRSQCPSLLESYSKPDADLHLDTAVRVFGVRPDVDPPDKVNKARKDAKIVNFGIVYGRTAHGMSEQLQISLEESQAYLDAYFAAYPGIVRYFAETAEYVQRYGEIVTTYGRVRKLPYIYNAGPAKDPKQKSPKAAIRAAYNHQIQGLAAEVTNLGNLSACRVIRDREWDVKPCLQIHDEVLFYVSQDLDIDDVSETLQDAMADPIPCRVPLVTDAAYGTYWGEID